MQQPLGFVDLSLSSHGCWLYKSLYGLKQAPRVWYTRMSDYLLSIGFHASKVDTFLFILFIGTDIFYLLIDINDLLLTGSSSVLLHLLTHLLSLEFKLRDFRAAHYFLEIKVHPTSMSIML
jgi:hypothetical protein